MPAASCGVYRRARCLSILENEKREENELNETREMLGEALRRPHALQQCG